jgi:hypothetical protein
MGGRKGGGRYPRPQQRVAPTTLVEALLEPAPQRLVGNLGLRLSDLDETVWSQLPAPAIEELAELVVERVAAACARHRFDAHHFPQPPAGMTLAELNLEHRTHLCLAREGFEQRPERLGEQTIGQILAIRSFGPRCLVDVLSALETRLAAGHCLHGQLTCAAERLARIAVAAQTRSDDPRFGSLLHAIDVEARTALDLAERLLHRTQDPPDPAYVAEQVCQLSARLAATTRLTLEEELTEIFAATQHARNRAVVIGYYGWSDGRRHTLAEIGARYGMTRERARQICAKLVRRKGAGAILAPVTDRCLAWLAARLPAPVERLEAGLRAEQLTRVGLGLEHLAIAAKLLGRATTARLVRVGREKLAVQAEQLPVVPAIVEAATKEVFYHGVSTVDAICDALRGRFPQPVSAALVAETLQLLATFQWLDRSGGWFHLASIAKHGLPKAIEKILAVAGRLSVAALRAAVGRNRRMWKEPPSACALLEFCRQMPGVRIEGDQVIAAPARDWRRTLTGVELRLVEILQQHGPVMERSALEDLCLASGMNRFSFHAFLACSPVIAQFGYSVYGLLGTQITADQVRALVTQRRAERRPIRVLHEFGHTGDGRLWLRYRLSKAASTYAVITVPAALKQVIQGRFRLLDTDRQPVGTLAAKEGRAWGLGAYLRRCGAQVDDQVTVTFDPQHHDAMIALARPAEMQTRAGHAPPRDEM